MAKAGIDRQASGTGKFPVRHQRLKMSDLKWSHLINKQLPKTRQSVRG